MKHTTRIAFIAMSTFISASACAQSPATQPSADPATTQPATTQPARPDMTARLADNTIATKDIAYVANAADKQKLDIYAPRDAKGAPVILFVHGGEWTKGDKSEVSFKPRFFNQNGVVFISANYRLSGTDQHPAQVNDVASATRWVKDHIAEYGGDPSKVVLVGHSAGCHIVSMVGLDPRPLATVGLKPSDLSGVVCWSGGAYDLPAKVAENGKYAPYIRANFGPNESAWYDASPINHINDFKPLPPFMFASAEAGNANSRVLSEKMTALISDTGATASAALLAGKTHVLANHEVGMEGDITGQTLLQFVNSVGTR